MIIDSKKARLGLLLIGLIMNVLYVALWVVTGKDDAAKITTIAIFVLAVLVCWPYAIRDKRREAKLLKSGEKK